MEAVRYTSPHPVLFPLRLKCGHPPIGLDRDSPGFVVSVGASVCPRQWGEACPLLLCVPGSLSCLRGPLESVHLQGCPGLHRPVVWGLGGKSQAGGERPATFPGLYSLLGSVLDHWSTPHSCAAMGRSVFGL